MFFQLTGSPSSNPKRDAHCPIHKQAIRRTIKGEPPTGLLDSVRNHRSKSGSQMGPTLSAFDIFAVAFGSVADQPIDIPQAAKVLHVSCHAGKANGVVDDRWTELSLFQQDFSQTRQHPFLG